MKLGLANQLLNRLILPVCLIQIFQLLPQTFHSLCMLLLLYTCLSFGDIIRERVSEIHLKFQFKAACMKN